MNGKLKKGDSEPATRQLECSLAAWQYEFVCGALVDIADQGRPNALAN